MSTKHFFAVLLAAGILTATVVTVATVTIGPTYAKPVDCGGST
jgi:hypothetical protein